MSIMLCASDVSVECALYYSCFVGVCEFIRTVYVCRSISPKRALQPIGGHDLMIDSHISILATPTFSDGPI